MRTRVVIVVLVLGLIFAAHGLAAGNGSSDTVYGSSAGKVQSVITSTKAVVSSKAAVKGNTLPFTGLDLGVIFGAGLVLLGTGFGLRRLTRKPPIV